MKLKKQKIGYWISAVLLDIGIILLVQSGWESRGYGIFSLQAKRNSVPIAGQNLTTPKVRKENNYGTPEK